MSLRQFFVALIDVYSLFLVVRVLFSWLPPGSRANSFYEFLHAFTEPVLKPLRRIIPPFGGIDFTPLAPLLILRLIRGAILTR